MHFSCKKIFLALNGGVAAELIELCHSIDNSRKLFVRLYTKKRKKRKKRKKNNNNLHKNTENENYKVE